MIIDLKNLWQTGKSEENFYFEYVPEESLTEIPNTTVSFVKTNGKVFLDGQHSAFFEGEIVFTLKGECTRCLKETEREFIVEFSEHADNDDEKSYPVVNDKVDLRKIVEDAIMINIPVSFLCKEDCKGLCTVCGADLNLGDHKCKIKEGN